MAYLLYRVWTRQRHGPPLYKQADAWLDSGTACYAPNQVPPNTIGPNPVQPTLTWYDVYTAAKNVKAARKQVVVQPKNVTLVNFHTAVYTSGGSWDTTLNLLGLSVEVQGTPIGYVWHFGDGTSKPTTSPGTPYPNPTITHQYVKLAHSVPLTVTTSYRLRFRVNGGGWQRVPRPLPATGPATNLRVREIVPTLTDGQPG